ncbi:MAG: FtsX-like permease family protein [Verrucomicrobiota bacterium]
MNANAPSSRSPVWAFLQHFFSAWTWRMAWRDSRSSRRHLLLFSTSIMLGIGALVAVSSLGRNLQQHIDDQARSLVGADLVVNSRRPFTPEMNDFFKSFGGEQSFVVNFSSMLGFENGQARLVQVRAIEGGFPFYGQLETEPASAAQSFRTGGGALVEDSLLAQYNVQVGDTVRIGGLTTRVAGRLLAVPGETVAFATFAPRVYIPLDDLRRSNLIQPGSLVRFRMYFRFGPEVNVKELVEQVGPQLEADRLSYDTVEERQKDLGRAMSNLYQYLSLTGFVALLLGGVGVASAINVHIREKLNTVAVLRCLGCNVQQSFAIYLAQGLALGAIGTVAGALLGLGIQAVLPRVVADFVPFEVQFAVSWPDVFKAMGIGFTICLLFALLPLLPVRRVSPLAAIRASFDLAEAPRRDYAVWLVYVLLGAGIVAFSISQARRWEFGLSFAGALAAVFALLALCARVLMWLVRRYLPSTLPYVWRQGLSNLYRPNNRTVLMLVSLGLGTFLILTLYLSQQLLLAQLVQSEKENQANAILFDIQIDQKKPVVELLDSLKLPVLREAPVVSMRLASVKGRSVESILNDERRTMPGWVLRREYRSTYRDHLSSTEERITGDWPPKAETKKDVVPISVEEGIARDLGLRLGDELVFDVQGVPMTAMVASVRKVDWRRLEPNFFIVFPTKALEGAPAFYIMSTRVASSEESARMQRELLRKFPNVSTVDLTLILNTLNQILDKAAFVIRFMALFSVGTGLLVLIGTVLTSRFQRVRESILLRTLGATEAQVQRILFIEYLSLGVLAGLVGALLAVLANWGLAKFVFQVPYVLLGTPVLVALGAVGALTVVIGLMANRGVCRHPPLEILRAEV